MIQPEGTTIPSRPNNALQQIQADSLVVNHGLVGGRARAFDSVLQTGTAVLIDPHGVPVVRCACGNPLLEPTGAIDTDITETSGEAWDGFDLEHVVTIDPPDDPLDSLTLTDIDTGEALEVDLGRETGAEVDPSDYDNSNFPFPDYPDGTYVRGQVTVIHPNELIGCDIITGEADSEWTGDLPGTVACWVDASWVPESVPPEENLSPGMIDPCLEVARNGRGLDIVGGVDGPPAWACDFEFAFSSFFAYRIMGDAPADEPGLPELFGLPVGHSITYQGTTCTSDEDGMTCENESGHGFAFDSEGYEFY